MQDPNKNIRFHELYNPTIQALHTLGGSGTNKEIHDQVVDIMRLSDEIIAQPHKPGSSSLTRLEYRLYWVRTWLKRYGLIENSSRGVWALTPKGKATPEIDGMTVEKAVNEMVKQEKRQAQGLKPAETATESEESAEEEVGAVQDSWREILSTTLLDMTPAAFERLCQRILRESGFSQVEVTGKTGDGGIDGIGVVRISGFLSFKVLFQCKRWRNAVGASIVRDFRGAMTGRTEKGLILTTGGFTQGAQREATRDGAPEIDLVDGEQLIDKLKELSLGVNTNEVVVEQVIIDPDFFAKI